VRFFQRVWIESDSVTGLDDGIDPAVLRFSTQIMRFAGARVPDVTASSRTAQDRVDHSRLQVAGTNETSTINGAHAERFFCG
jgi:hypothetical protein